MVAKTGAARRPGAESRARPDALDDWHRQELTPLDCGEPNAAPSEQDRETSRWVSGWWLGPANLLAPPAWIALALALF